MVGVKKRKYHNLGLKEKQVWVETPLSSMKEGPVA